MAETRGAMAYTYCMTSINCVCLILSTIVNTTTTTTTTTATITTTTTTNCNKQMKSNKRQTTTHWRPTHYFLIHMRRMRNIFNHKPQNAFAARLHINIFIPSTCELLKWLPCISPHFSTPAHAIICVCAIYLICGWVISNCSK